MTNYDSIEITKEEKLRNCITFEEERRMQSAVLMYVHLRSSNIWSVG